MKNVKRHFFSRSLFSNTLQLYSYAVLINQLSAQAYSSLFQYSSLVPCFILMFMMTVNKGHLKGHIWMQAAVFTTIVGGLVFPNNNFVFALALMGLLNDFMGMVTYPLFIERRCKMSLQSEMFVAFNNSDMLGRIVACSAMFVFSKLNLFSYVSYLLVPLFLLQIYGLYRIIRLPEVSASESETEKPVQKIKQGLTYIAKMPIGRMLLALLVWIQVSKFLLEYSFYQEVDTIYKSKDEIGAYIGGFHLVNTAFSYLFALFINRSNFAKDSPSTALIPAPIFILIFSIAGLFTHPFLMFSANLFVFLILFRSLLRPTSRQLLNIAPTNIVNEVAFSLTFITCITNFLTGTWARLMADRLDSQLTAIMCATLALVGLTIFLQVDSYFVRNLWKTVKRQFSLNNNNLDAIPIESRALTNEMLEIEEDATPETQLNRLETIYHHSYNADLLRKAFLIHARNLFTHNNISDFSLLYKFSLKATEKIRSVLAQDSRKVPILEAFDYIVKLEEHMHSSSLPAATKEQIRNYFIKQVGIKIFNPNLAKFKRVTELSPRQCQDILELISTPKYSQYEIYVFDCVKDQTIHLAPLLESIFLIGYNEGKDLQSILSDLFKHDKLSVQLFLQNHMSLNLQHLNQDEIMHLLFFSELFSRDKTLRKDLQVSIEDLFSSKDSDIRDVYINIHLKVLYKTPYYNHWKSYFTTLKTQAL